MGINLLPHILKNMEKKIEKVIEELEYAKKIHLWKIGELGISLNNKIWRKKLDMSPGDKKWHKKIINQKEIIIKALKKEIPTTKKHIKIVSAWQRTHWKWLEYYAHWYKQPKISKKKEQELKKDRKEEGTVNWQIRWIRNYNWAIYYLEKNKDKSSKKK